MVNVPTAKITRTRFGLVSLRNIIVSFVHRGEVMSLYDVSLIRYPVVGFSVANAINKSVMDLLHLPAALLCHRLFM
jgi:hypothetical protein